LCIRNVSLGALANYPVLTQVVIGFDWGVIGMHQFNSSGIVF